MKQVLALMMALLVACDGEGGAPADDGGTDDGREGGARVDDASTVDAAALDAGAPDAAPSCEPAIVYPPDLLPECPSCPGARCVSGDLLEPAQRDALRDCNATHECMPDEYLLAGDAYVPPSCVAAFGAEGRCLSTCLPGVWEERDVLAESSCPATHRCVPCFSPFDGAATGACGATCDEGPVEPPVVLPTCCEGRGTCIPTELVPSDAHRYYDACEGDDAALCVPLSIATDVDYAPAGCTATEVAALYGDEYGPGVCAHVCQAGLDDVVDFLRQNDCDDQFVCVPCLDPVTGEPSGACEAP